MKETQSLLTELWDKSFSKEVIEKDLGLTTKDWDRSITNLVSFLAQHKIKNQNLNHLFEESKLESKIKAFSQSPHINKYNGIKTQEGRWIEFKTLCLKDDTSFLAIGNSRKE